MKAKDIEIGGIYIANVSSRLVRVRVIGVREMSTYRRNPFEGPQRCITGLRTVYDVTNLRIGRKLTFKSAQKFRAVAPAQSET